jgi:hypothetical protein
MPGEWEVLESGTAALVGSGGAVVVTVAAVLAVDPGDSGQVEYGSAAAAAEVAFCTAETGLICILRVI